MHLRIGHLPIVIGFVPKSLFASLKKYWDRQRVRYQLVHQNRLLLPHVKLRPHHKDIPGVNRLKKILDNNLNSCFSAA